MGIKGQVALVTGAARRVGRAIVTRLAQEGANVLIHYRRSEEEALALAGELGKYNVRTYPVQANLGNPIDIEEMFVQAETIFGRIDILVNSAAAFHRGDLLTTTVDDWNYTMAVNLRAPFLCIQRAAHLMWARGEGGSIVNISDAVGVSPWAAYPEHSVSKAGLISLTKVAAKSLAEYGIRVNAIVPGPVERPDQMPQSRWAEIGAALPLKTTGDASHIADGVLSLIQNDFITGAVLNIDGGDSLLNLEDLIGS